MSQATTLPKTQRQILESLADGKLHTYREIVMATGKYSNLPGELRNRHERSLGAKGFVREIQVDVGTDIVATFQINPFGCRELGIAVPKIVATPKVALDDFLERWRQWREQYKREAEEAAKIELRHNPYLLLKALATYPNHAFTLGELAKTSGVFSGLVQDLRCRHGRHSSNLGHLGLAVEGLEITNEDKSVFTFQITEKGLKLLAKLKP